MSASPCKLFKCQGKRGCLCIKVASPKKEEWVQVNASSSIKLSPKPRKSPANSTNSSPASASSRLKGSGGFNKSQDPPVSSIPVPQVEQESLSKSLTEDVAAAIIEAGEAESSESSPQAEESLPPTASPSASSADTTPATNSFPASSSVRIRYNHYDKSFALIGGLVTKDEIDKEYSLSFVFKEAKLHVSAINPSSGTHGYEDDQQLPPFVTETDEAFDFTGLDTGIDYWIFVEESVEERAKAKAAQHAAYEAANARREAEEVAGDEGEKDGLDGFGGEDKANCSCIEGNPCVSKYNCKDWNNRFEVAKNNGWKGHS